MEIGEGMGLLWRDRRLRASLKPGLKAGSYRVSVRWLSPDGHVETKTWSFRLR